MARSSKWTFLIYPDSCPNAWENQWKDILVALHVPCAVSPLHDKDLNPDGEEKKPHYHVMLEYDSLKSFKQVSEDIAILNGTIPQIVKSPVGMIRYFIHKDNPEKHQYDFADITVLNGFDIEKYDSYTDAEIDHIIADITNFIDVNQIYEYADLVAWTRNKENEHFEDWYKIIRKNTFFFSAYLSSRRNQYKEWKKQQTNK